MRRRAARSRQRLPSLPQRLDGIAVPLGGAPLAPAGRAALLGGLLATPRFAAEQEPQQSGCPSRCDAIISATPWSPQPRHHRGSSSRHRPLGKFRGRNTILASSGSIQEAKREAKLAVIEWRRARAEDSHLPPGRRLRLSRRRAVARRRRDLLREAQQIARARPSPRTRGCGRRRSS